MTKRALLKDYINQIEKLKADLSASRDKNGIYLSPESYNALVSENQGTKTSVDELTKILAAKKEEFDEFEQKFKLQSEMLKAEQVKLAYANNEINEKSLVIEKLNENIVGLNNDLMEQKLLTAAHEQKEEELDLLASKLAQDLENSNKELEGMQNKIGKYY